MKEFKIKMKNQTVHELKTIDKQQDLCGCEKRADLIALLLEELKKKRCLFHIHKNFTNLKYKR